MNPRPKDVAAVTIIALVILYGVRNHGSIVAPSGPVHAVIIHETAEDTQEIGNLIVQLRGGSAAEYFAASGRRLSILDDDGTDEAGKQVIPKEDVAGVTPPAILFYAGNKLVGKEPLPATATTQSVIELARRYGG